MIDANAVGSGPQLDITVGDSSVAIRRDDGDAPLSRGTTIGGAALSHAAKPRGRTVEPWARSTRSALLRSCS
jgi:hypothetical protein